MPTDKRLVMSLSNKGGVTKTTFMRLLTELHQLAGSKLTLIDGDGSVGQMMKYYGARDGAGRMLDPQPPSGVLPFDFHGDANDRDALATLLQHGTAATLVDLPAISLSGFQQLQSELDAFEVFRSLGYATTIVAPLTPFEASLRDVSDTLELVNHTERTSTRNNSVADIVILRPLYTGDPDDFIFWDASNTKKVVESARIPVLDIPKLKTRILALLDYRDIRFVDGYSSSELNAFDRSRVTSWITACIDLIAPHAALFGFAKHGDLKAAFTKYIQQSAAQKRVPQEALVGEA